MTTVPALSAAERTADRLLFQLKSRGPQATSTLAAACALSPMGAHKRLQALAADGLVAWHDEPQGVGRPRRVWRLTSAGHGRFPDRHGDLLVQLLGHLRAQWGDEGMDRLVTAREVDAEAAYRQALDRCADLGERVRALAALRHQEGYMARAEEDGAGGWLLVEDHCPICAAATTCQGFCRSELALFQRLLAPHARVERSEHLLAGGRRCTYRVRPAPAEGP